MVVGDFSLSYDQAKSQFALWSIMSSQLLMSSDLRNIKPEMTEILVNSEVIAVNQDRLGKMGMMIYKVVIHVCHVIFRFSAQKNCFVIFKLGTNHYFTRLREMSLVVCF